MAPRSRNNPPTSNPAFFQRPDGSYYETAIFVTEGTTEYTRSGEKTLAMAG